MHTKKLISIFASSIILLTLIFQFSCKKDEKESTPQITVTTLPVTGITINSATGGGAVASTESVEITARGVCWGKSENPTISDDHTLDSTGMGAFVSEITGLDEGTAYYVCAYAKSSQGVIYGKNVQFTTLSLSQLPTVITDAASNITQ